MDWNASIFGGDVGRSRWLTSLGSLRHRLPFVEICKLGASAQADARTGTRRFVPAGDYRLQLQACRGCLLCANLHGLAGKV